MIRSYAPGGKLQDAYYWQPEDDYSWFDNLGDQWSEGVFGQMGQWLARKDVRKKEEQSPYNAIRDRGVLEEVVGNLTYHEMYQVINQEAATVDEAALIVQQEREAAKRRERLRDAGPIQTFTAGMVADLPLLLAELAVFRSSGPMLRYMRAPRMMQSFVGRDLLAASTVEYTAAGVVAGVNPHDTVEDAIINGTMGTLFSAAMIGGIEGTRAAWGKYRSHQRLKETPPPPPPSGPC